MVRWSYLNKVSIIARYTVISYKFNTNIFYILVDYKLEKIKYCKF